MSLKIIIIDYYQRTNVIYTGIVREIRDTKKQKNKNKNNVICYI